MSDESPKINLSALLKGIAPERTRHNYYCAKSGTMAARALGQWHKEGCKSKAIKTAGTGMGAPALATKLRLGLEWLCENTQDEVARKFFEGIKDIVKIRGDSAHGIVYVEKCVDFMTNMEDADNSAEVAAELKQDLARWIASDPPLDAKWQRDGFSLGQEDMIWFKTKLAELEREGYCGVVKLDRIKILRTPLEELERRAKGEA